MAESEIKWIVMVMVIVMVDGDIVDPGRWHVYQLAAGDNNGDSDTRLTLDLKESLGTRGNGSLSSFSCCLWYSITSFLDASTVLSYATPEIDDTLRIRPFPDALQITYMDDFLPLGPESHQVIAPKTWNSLCMAISEDRWEVWIGKRVYRGLLDLPPLPLNGILVLGQEQDELDGGYTEEQSLVGDIIGLTLWDSALSSEEMHDWSSCVVPMRPAILAWDEIQWTVHNGTGDLHIHHNGPCSHGGDVTRDMVLFTFRMKLQNALKFLDIINFDIVTPRSDKEVLMVSQLIKHNQEHCSLKVREGYGVLLGIIMKDSILNMLNNSTVPTDEEIPDTVRNMVVKKLFYLTTMKRLGHNRNVPIIQNSKGWWDITGDYIKMCFVGSPRGTTVFNLRGLPSKLTEDVPDHTFSFVLTLDQMDSRVYFHGFRKMHIKKDYNSNWCLVGHPLQTNDKVCVSSDKLPIGRNEWVFSRRHQTGGVVRETLKLYLSICSDTEYTCGDGSCIDLFKVCDFNYDCQDHDDETGCATALLPPGYLRSYPPTLPLPVSIDLRVNRIINFDLLTMTFQIDMDIWIVFKDPRITFIHLFKSQDRKVVADGGTEVWKPDLAVTNAVDNIQTSSILTVERQSEGLPTHLGYEYSGQENSMQNRVNLRCKVHCQYELNWYPWDVQECYVKIRITNVRHTDLMLNRSSGVTSYPRVLGEYIVRSCKLYQEEKSLADTITLKLVLSRRFEYHLFTTFLPTSLLLVLGYGTLLLPVESVNERGTMSLTTLLVFISLYTETSSSLPSTAYLKYIDIWFVFSISYLSAIIIVHLASAYYIPSSSPTAVWPLRGPPSAIKSSSQMSHKILKRGNIILLLTLIVFSLFYLFNLIVNRV